MTGAVTGPASSTPGRDGRLSATPSQPTGPLTGPSTAPLTAESLVDRLASALNLPDTRPPSRPFLAILQTPRQHAGAQQLPPSFNAATFNAAAPPGDRDFLIEDYWSRQQGADNPGHRDAAYRDDLPRLFYRSPTARPVQPTRRHAKPVQYPLAAKSMACGFAIGIAMAGPALWLTSDQSGPGSSLQTEPMLLAGAPVAGNLTTVRRVSTDASADSALAAFDEAQRRIAAGDYIGARDLLRRAAEAGQDRAQAWLDALN
jgi:hypothetical protein